MNKEPERTQRKKHLGEVVHHQLKESGSPETIPWEKFAYMQSLVRKLLRKE